MSSKVRVPHLPYPFRILSLEMERVLSPYRKLYFSNVHPLSPRAVL